MSKLAPCILIVDDVELNRAILAEVFSKTYTILEAENGKEAVAIMEAQLHQIDMVLLDIIMPYMDGFEVLKIMNQKHWIEQVPVIMISSEASEDFVLKGYELGVSDYISRPFSSSIVSKRVSNIVDLYHHRNQLMSMVKEQTEKLKQSNLFMIDTLSTAVEFRNGESGMHIRRVRKITELLLKKLMERYPEYHLNNEQREEIANAAALHDLGKISIPEYIINKPGKLTKEEFEIMKEHTSNGAAILRDIDHVHEQAYIRYCYDICLYHHERWDGKGYPEGLCGSEIPLCAQIVSIADVYDALTSERVYKPAYSHQDALHMILQGECGAFNPQLLDCLLAYEETMEEELNKLSNSYMESENTTIYDRKSFIADDQISDRTLRLLELERDKYHTLASLSGEILFDYDVTNDSIKFSEKFKDVFNSDIVIPNFLQKVKKHDISIIDDQGAAILKDINQHIKDGYTYDRAEIKLFTKQKCKEWFEIILNTVWDNEKNCKYMIGKITNINHQKVHTKLLEKKANHDALTGLNNLAHAKELIVHVLNNSETKHGAFVFIDVDNFKTINDTYGHTYGDKMLVKIAHNMNTYFNQDDICGRIGGDEFIVWIRDVKDEAGVKDKIEQFKNALTTNKDEGISCPLTLSFGIAFCPQEGNMYEELFKKADIALYESKKKGKNGYTIYHENMNDTKTYGVNEVI